MAMFENFPYTDMHNLNLDWIIKIAKDFLDQYTHIQQLISDGEESLQNLTEEGLSQLQEKAENLESLLQAWYDTHSADIANQLASALSDLNTWYNTHQNYLDATLASNIQAFQSAANLRAQEAIETIPADYTTFYNETHPALPHIINFKQYTEYPYAIDQNNLNKWVYYNTLGCVLIPLYDAKRMDIVGNAARQTRYAFLKSNNINNGTVADISAITTGVQIMTVGQNASLDVPSDAKYLYVYSHDGSGYDYLPQLLKIYQNIYKAENDIIMDSIINTIAAEHNYTYPATEGYHYVINTNNNNKWAYYSTLLVNICPLDGVEKVSIKANANRQSIIAFLKTANMEQDVAADLSDEQNAVINIPMDCEYQYYVPSDAHYLYIYVHDAGNTEYKPQSVKLFYNAKETNENIINRMESMKETPCLFDIVSPEQPSLGFANRKTIDHFITAEDINICALIEITNTPVVFLGSLDTLGQDHASHIQFDFSARQMRFYARGAGTSQPTTIIHTVDISSVVNGTKYKIYAGCINRDLFGRIENYTTGESIEYIVPIANDNLNPCGWLQDKLTYGFLSGAATFKRISAFTTYKPYIAFVGDSITLGAYVPYDKSFPYLIGTELDKSFIALGRGGATIEMGTRIIHDIIAKIHPVITVVTLGTNGSVTEADYLELIEELEKTDTVIVINEIPMSADTATTITKNNIIESLNKLTSRFDYATALNNLPGDGQNQTLFISDRLHLNETGHQVVTNRFLNDLKYIITK